MKHLPKALLLALLVGTPAFGQEKDWRSYRERGLGPDRSWTMAACAEGRKNNQRNQSYWGDLETTLKVRNELAAIHGSTTKAEAIHSGLAAAMAIACPNVW